MKVLVTAGSTIVPIDQVRAITNIFKGRTGLQIALAFLSRYHTVDLFTSSTDIATFWQKILIWYHVKITKRLSIYRFSTFNTLEAYMRTFIPPDKTYNQKYDAIIHSAAVSDYVCTSVLDANMNEIDNSSKISSDNETMYLKLKQTPKLVDYIKTDWGFNKILVKFKLQVGITDNELIDIASESRIHSDAEFIVANTLEGFRKKAFIVSKDSVLSMDRQEMPKQLVTQVEWLHNERTFGNNWQCRSGIY